MLVFPATMLVFPATVLVFPATVLVFLQRQCYVFSATVLMFIFFPDTVFVCARPKGLGVVAARRS